MKDKEVIDNIDKQILSLLLADAKVSYSEMAKTVNISSVAIHQRVKRMEEAKIITGSKIEVDLSKIGIDVVAYAGVHFDNAGSYKSVLEKLRLIPEVVECHYTTGTYSAILKIICKSNKELMSVLGDKLIVRGTKKPPL